QPPTPSQPGAISCPKCGTQNPVTARFCMNCGSPLQATINCPQCGSQIPAGAKFCMNCGTKLQ
ncbi:MAG: zinc-ribbon domain-containing protein, partial [Thermoproteota archaeon]